ncbi:unnamed protein product, partial [Mesorhabditis belari]|uniref:Serine-threonine/tyrosine-protein kinase catalytic domain-containing protein n=1 Tax=Mesorhabditis belari TaxID=2138241 RepID=A0AAF3FN65_9BILA
MSKETTKIAPQSDLSANKEATTVVSYKKGALVPIPTLAIPIDQNADRSYSSIYSEDFRKRMEKLEEMPCFIYELVMKCWRKQPIDRLNFCEIADLLEPFYIESEFVHVEALLERNEETKGKLARKSSRMRR